MSKAVIYENTDKLVVSTPFNAEFVQFLKENISKKDKEWSSRMKTWTITNAAKEVVLAKVTEMFEVEEFEFDFNVSIAKDELTAKVTDEVAATFTYNYLQHTKVGLCENTEGTVRSTYVSYDLSYTRIMNKKNGKFVVVYQAYSKAANEFINYVRFYQIVSNQVIEITYEQFKDVNFTAVVEVVFTKDVSPAPAPKNEEPKKVEKIETTKEEKKEITEVKEEVRVNKLTQSLNQEEEKRLENTGRVKPGTFKPGKTRKAKEENQDSEIEVFEVNGIHCIEKELEKEIKDDKTAYHNENSGWYLINDNYKDAEEEIDLTQYKVVKIESSETGNDEVDEGFWVWEAENGVWFLEEEGCFMKFESLEKLIRQHNYEKVLREEEVEYYDFNANVNYDEFN